GLGLAARRQSAPAEHNRVCSEGMSPAERAHPGADMERFVREQMAFMGLTEADVEAIRRTAPLVLKHEAALTEALYDHFLRFPETAQFFVGAVSLAQTALADVLRSEVADPREALEASVAWNKLLLVHLNVLLLGYLLPP